MSKLQIRYDTLGFNIYKDGKSIGFIDDIAVSKENISDILTKLGFEIEWIS
jgi:hypothetical protein